MKTFTFRNYLDATSSDVSLLKTDTATIVEHFRPQHQIISKFASAIFLVDFSNQKYLYMEESCFNMLGYTAKHFLDNGLEASLCKWHPADLEIVNLKVWPDNLSFLRSLPNQLCHDFIMSNNFRMRNANGEYITLLQRISFIAGNEPGLPVGVIGVAFDITHYKTDNSIVHTIEKAVSATEGMVNELMLKKVHPVFDKSQELLTIRETEILQFMAQGLSSKQIAAEVGLSINTVNNHRKNMLAKTSCRTSAELTMFATRHGLI